MAGVGHQDVSGVILIWMMWIDKYARQAALTVDLRSIFTVRGGIHIRLAGA